MINKHGGVNMCMYIYICIIMYFFARPFEIHNIQSMAVEVMQKPPKPMGNIVDLACTNVIQVVLELNQVKIPIVKESGQSRAQQSVVCGKYQLSNHMVKC